MDLPVAARPLMNGFDPQQNSPTCSICIIPSLIVTSFPFRSLYLTNPYLSILVQILIAAVGVYVFFLLTRIYQPLTILSGGR